MIDDGRVSIDVLKLHGSLNWMTAAGVRNDRMEIKVFEPHDFDLTKGDGQVRIAAQAMEKFWEGIGTGRRRYVPVIVPPTWSKPGYYQTISPVWRNAAWHLSQAENIIIIGYSLPETDQFFRGLFALGTVGDALLRRVWVFDKFADDALKKKYRGIFGTGTVGTFRMYRAEFKDVVLRLSENLDDLDKLPRI
jgi:hypothetical protein